MQTEHTRSPSRLAGLLACPQCRRTLSIDEARRVVTCPDHGDFPFAGRFVSLVQGHDEAFEDHWDRNATTNLAPDKLALAERFLAPLAVRMASGRRFSVLDAGCGEGAHIAALSRRLSGPVAPLVGLDIAASALREAERDAAPQWDFVHGDMMALPFPDASFDAVFSFGVLALTPNPRGALAEMTRVLRPGGLLGLWVFPGQSAVIRTGLRCAGR